MTGTDGSGFDQGRIDYGRLMHDAMRHLIHTVLSQVAKSGLPGDHHFFISFDTSHPGVELAAWLRERYPEEMTIVIQNWYEGLEVRPDGFGITLNFGNAPERMEIPFDALRTFVDPSVEFGLRFDTPAEDDAVIEPLDPATMDHPAPHEEVEEEPRGDAEVVNLDQFRK